MKRFIILSITSILLLNVDTYANEQEQTTSTEVKIEIETSTEALDEDILLKIDEAITGDGKTSIVKYESYKADKESFENEVPKEFESENFKYILENFNVDKKFRKEEKECIEKVEKIITKAEKESFTNDEVLELFEDETTYTSEDEFVGNLKKMPESIKIEPNESSSNTTYTSKTITLTENKTYYGFESNDYSLIPQTITKNGVTLNLANANFVGTNNEAISSVADTGVGTLYNCNAVYKGSYLKQIPNTTTSVTYYKVTLDYKGNISKNIFEKNVITATYKGEKMLNPVIPIAVATTTGSAGLIGFFVFFFTKKNVKVYNVIGSGGSLIGKIKLSEKDRVINLDKISSKATTNIYKLVLDKTISKKLENTEIEIQLMNLKKPRKVVLNENGQAEIDIKF